MHMRNHMHTYKLAHTYTHTHGGLNTAMCMPTHQHTHTHTRARAQPRARMCAPIVVGGGRRNGLPDLVAALLDLLLVAAAVQHYGVVLGHCHLFGRAQVGQLQLLHLHAQLLCHQLRARGCMHACVVTNMRI